MVYHIVLVYTATLIPIYVDLHAFSDGLLLSHNM